MEPIKFIIEQSDRNFDRNDRNFDSWFAFSDFHLKELCVAYGIPSEGPKKQKAARLAIAWEMG